jgi:hypothetical protein
MTGSAESGTMLRVSKFNQPGQIQMTIKATLVTFFGIALQGATIPGPGYQDLVVLCDTNNTHCTTLVSSTNSSLSYSNTFTVGGNAFNVSAFGQVQPGILHAYAHFDTTATQSFYTQFQFGGQVNEDFTFGGGPSGTVGYVSPTFAVTGTSTGAANASVGVFYEDSTDLVLHSLPSQYIPGNASLTFGRIPYHYGSPIMISFFFGAIVYPSGSLLATSDFSHTAVLSGLPTYSDAVSNTPLTTTTIGSTSGATYTAAGIVPEPATFVTLGAGLLAVVLGRRRGRKGADRSMLSRL